MKRNFALSVISTACFFWLVHGPNLEGLTSNTALAFFGGIAAGISWGFFLIALLKHDIERDLKRRLTQRPPDGATAPRLFDTCVDCCEIEPLCTCGKPPRR